MNSKPTAWYDKAVGGFYLSKESIPKSAWDRGGIVELFEKDSVVVLTNEKIKP